MKLSVLAALVCLSSFGREPATQSATSTLRHECFEPTVDDEPPPPPECPMCGGNAELHRVRSAYMFEVRAAALLLSLTAH